jgi:hypothetical protein
VREIHVNDKQFLRRKKFHQSGYKKTASQTSSLAGGPTELFIPPELTSKD